MAKLFVIGIGGTGMRCLESFVHLCAAGLFEGKEIELLTLDTDAHNGNKARVEQLINLYNDIKTDNASSDTGRGGKPNMKSFFSAKLNLRSFNPDYTGQSFATMAGLGGKTTDEDLDNQDLADLFLDPDSVQKFNLEHGYRAQTHLGSMLMYHGIIEAAIQVKKNKETASARANDLMDYIKDMQEAGADARVFVFGSVFGGTGASSIPIIPPALNEASQILNGQKIDIKYGSTLLTHYFTFPAPDEAQRNNNAANSGIVADSANFPINSQAALQFYQANQTVKDTYKRLYHIGWPFSSTKVDEGGTTKTGGSEQKNACHVAELMCACAAYDFFTFDKAALDETSEAQYLYRAVEADENGFNFEAEDFVDNFQDFKVRLRALFVFAHTVLKYYGAANGDGGARKMVDMLVKYNNEEFKDLFEDADYLKRIDKYFRDFFGYKVENGVLVPAWIYQLKGGASVGKLIFPNGAYAQNIREIDDPLKVFQEKQGGLFDKRRSVDNFIDTLKESKNWQIAENQNITTKKEKFLALVYYAICTTLEGVQ